METNLILVETTLNEYGVSEVGPKLEMQLQPRRKEVPNTDLIRRWIQRRLQGEDHEVEGSLVGKTRQKKVNLKIQ